MPFASLGIVLFLLPLAWLACAVWCRRCRVKQNEASHLISPRSSRACGELASIGYQAAGHDKFDTAGSHVSRALGPLQQEGANELQLMVDFLEGRRPNVEFLSGGEEQHFTLTRSAARPRSRVGIAVDRITAQSTVGKQASRARVWI